MAKSKTFFYTDIDRLDAQSPAQAFGPDSVTPNVKYNVGSRHSYSGSGSSGPNAYAVLNGTVVIRKVPGSSPALVNLILKPSVQPTVEGMPTIKYIVYRGILASSLYTSSGGQDFMLPDSDPNANHLTKKMQESHANRGGVGPAPADALFLNGVPVVLPDGTTETAQTAKLFRAFNAGKVFDPTIDGMNQTQDVDAGNYIGRFNPVDFGIEFIQDNIGFDPDIQYAELNKKSINLPADSPEDILPFIDPCGFYGSFTEGQIYVHSNSGGSTGAPGTPVKGALEVYNTILQPFFVNCNTVLVEIRNQFNFSYDYFNEYSGSVLSDPTANLKFSTNSAEIQTSYDAINYNDFNGIHWPIMFVKASNFSSASNGNPKSTLCLSFAKGSNAIPDENENPVIYVAQGKLKSTFKKKTGRCVLGEFGEGLINDTNFTKPIKIELLNAGASAGPISCYIRIKYSKQYSMCPTPISNGSVLRSIEILDNIFCPFDMQVKNPVSTTHLQIRVFEEEIHVDALGFTGQSHFSHQGVVRDASGTVTFFVVARQKVVKDQGSVYQPIPVTDNSLQTPVTFPEYFTQQNGDLVMNASDIIVGPAGGPALPPIIPGLLVSQRVGDTDTYKDYNPNDILWINFSAIDFETLRVTMNNAGFDNGWKGVRLGLVFNQGVFSPAGDQFAQFRVVLRGYINGLWTEVPTTVFHFRLSGLINLNPLLPGDGYTITEHDDPTNNFVEPNGQIAHLPGSASQNIPTYTINSTIYLQRGWNIGNDEFCQFAAYMEDNIKTVWDSSTNWGLGSMFLSTDVAIDPMISIVGAGQPTGDFSRSHIILSDGIKVKVATAKQFQKLNKGECMFIVSCAPQGRRSYVSENRRTGEMFYELMQPDNTTANNATVPYVGLANVPAHEFGHVLGLADYYGYVAEVGAYGASNNNKDVVNPVRGGTTGVYHIGLNGLSFDPEYGVRYNWVHNLMSSMMNVQNITGSLMRQDGTAKNFTFTKTYQEYFKWYARTLPDSSTNPKITIFVTPTQLTHIIDGEPQDGMRNYVCFRDDWNGSTNPINSAYNNYDGTFTSPTKDGNGDIKIYTDEQFRNRHNFSGTYDVLFNRFEHNMDYRIKADPAGTGTHYENAYTSYFNPFYANPDQSTNLPDNRNKLNESNIIEPTQFNPLHFVYPEGRNMDFMYDISVGGFAFNTAKGLRVCQNQVNDVASATNPIYNLLPTAPNTLAVPVPDDVLAAFLKTNKAPDIGINARRIFANALWYVSRHLKAIVDGGLTFAGDAIVPAFTTYEQNLLRFIQKNNNLPFDEVDKSFWVPNPAGVGQHGPFTTSGDKYRNVGEASVASARNYWNHERASDDSDGNGILIQDGNGKYTPIEFEQLTRTNSNYPSGWRRHINDTVTYSQHYSFFPNRRTIIRLIRDGILQ